ncbi:glycosyltransferase [Desulfobulbus alkaliphilus]|uniref:glycosyltransferase n=1 Tax=Desulfobulbus alkaliphilus TaxID=869814 RepID=UPI00196389E8|nr:glycosyltransferase [Desulfobulbus alkaliphilus]MBM9538341.1 glycosyltransferase [Desulfobulbus alkaliphilus]
MQSPISVISVTFNASKHLPDLVESLRTQTDPDFEWIIVDGASTDGTVEVIQSANDVVTQWLSEPDFGIYHAMNKALQMATGEYYLILGADDRLTPEAIEQYKSHAYRTKADIITAKIIREGKVEKRKPCWPWLYAHHAFVSEHSVGSLIRRSLHDKFGLYSKRYSIGADLVFLKKACMAPETRVVQLDFIAGTFGFTGRSRSDRAGAICDYFRGQFETEKFKYLQIFLFVLKVLKNAPEMVKAATKKS